MNWLNLIGDAMLSGFLAALTVMGVGLALVAYVGVCSLIGRFLANVDDVSVERN